MSVEPQKCPKCNGFGLDTDPPNHHPWIHWPCSLCKGSGKSVTVRRSPGRPRKLPVNPKVPPTGIEAQVCKDIAARQAVGLKKYGITIAENPAGRVERIRHAYEEACDLCVYLRWELSKAEGEEQP